MRIERAFYIAKDPRVLDAEPDESRAISFSLSGSFLHVSRES